MQDVDNSNPNFDDSNTNDEGFKNETTKVEAGDNFVVIYNELENGDPFYVILCDQALHECEAIFEDDWGNTWYAGEMFLCNVWYHHVLDQ